MSDEKRRFTRIPFKVKAEINLAGKLQTVEEINNLSVGGCMLPIVAQLEPGTSCKVRILLGGTADEVAVNIDGEVVRCLPDAVAVKFTRIDPDSLFHLQNIIRYNSPDADAIDNEIDKHPGLL